MEDVLKASCREALESLQKGQRISNTMMLQLSQEGLIEVNPIKNLASPGNAEGELLFLGITERGKLIMNG